MDAARKPGNDGRTAGSRRLRLFIAYRQGATEGDACALWLHRKLSGASLESDGEGTAKLETYLDVRSPALGNWTEKWLGDLKTARALVLVCTPGVVDRRSDSDWLYREINWWVRNRKVAPILVDACGAGANVVPQPVAAKWPYAQRIPWSADATDDEKEIALERVRAGLVLSERGVNYEELTRLAWKNRILATAVFLIGLLAVGLFVTMRNEAAARVLAENNLRLSYGPNIQRAWGLWQTGQVANMRRLLESLPAQFRHWEWNHLRQLQDQSTRTISIGKRVESMDYFPDGQKLAIGQVGGVFATVSSDYVEERGKHGSVVTDRKTYNVGAESYTATISDEAAVLGLAVLGEDVFVTMGNDGVLVVSREGERGLAIHTNEQVVSFAASPNRKWIASAKKRGTVEVRRVEGGPFTFGSEIAIETGKECTALAVSPDGCRLACGVFTIYALEDFTQFCSIWDVTSQKLIGYLQTNELIVSIRFSPDGRVIYAGRGDGSIASWETATLAPGRTFAAPDTRAGLAKHLVLSSDGKLFAVAIDNRAVHVVDVTTGNRHVYTGVESDIDSLALSPDARTLAVAAGGEIKEFDLTRAPPSIDLEGSLEALSVTPDGRYIATTPGNIGRKDDEPPRIVVWDTRFGTRKLFPGKGALSIAMFSDGTRFAAGFENGNITVQRVDDGGVVWSATGPDRVGFLSLSPDGILLLSGGQSQTDDTVRVWDVANRKELKRLPGKDAVAFSPDGRLAVTGAKKTLQVRGKETPEPLFRVWTVPDFKELIALPDSAGKRISSIAFSSDSARVVVTYDSAIEIWDVRGARKLATLQDKSELLAEAAAFSPDGRRVATASDNTLSIWDVEAGHLLLRSDSGGRCGALAWIGDRLIVQTAHRQVSILSGAPTPADAQPTSPLFRRLDDRDDS
jgi:WD40 repeat protein